MNTTNSQKNRPLWFILLIGCLAYSSLYICRLNFSVASAALKESGSLDDAQIGVIGSVFSFVYAFSKVPAGILGDARSGRNVIALGLSITGLSNLLIAFSRSYPFIAILWGINAAGQAMLWGPLLRVFLDNYGADTLRKAGPILSATIALGGVLGLLCASYALSVFDVRFCFILPASAALVMASAVMVFMPVTRGHPNQDMSYMLSAAKKTVSRKEFLRIIVPSTSHGIIKDNINVWLALYIVSRYHIEITSAGIYVLFVPLLQLTGKTLYPIIQRKTNNDRAIVAVCLITCAAASMVLALDFVPIIPAIVLLGIISASVSMLNTYFLAVFPGEISELGNISFTASIMDLMTYCGAGAGALVFGVLITKYGYPSMFFIWAAVMVISIPFIVSQNRRQTKE